MKYQVNELLLRHEYFWMYTPIILSRITCCHGNHEISYYQNAFIFRTIFLHLNGPIEKHYRQNKMSYVFNLCLITHLYTSLLNGFALIFLFGLSCSDKIKRIQQ